MLRISTGSSKNGKMLSLGAIGLPSLSFDMYALLLRLVFWTKSQNIPTTIKGQTRLFGDAFISTRLIDISRSGFIRQMEHAGIYAISACHDDCSVMMKE